MGSEAAWGYWMTVRWTVRPRAWPSRSETWHTKTCLSMTEGVVIYTHLHLSPPQIAIPSVTIPSTYIRSLLHRFSFHSNQSPLSEGAFIMRWTLWSVIPKSRILHEDYTNAWGISVWEPFANSDLCKDNQPSLKGRHHSARNEGEGKAKISIAKA